MVGSSEFGIGGVRGEVGSLFGMRSNGGAKKGEDCAHGALVIAKVVGYSGIGMGDKVVGIGVGLFLVG